MSSPAPTYKNTYIPTRPSIPRDIHQHTPPDEYDFNYVGEVRALRSDRVELRPYVVSPDGGEATSRRADELTPRSRRCTRNRCTTTFPPTPIF
jgi:hypothetical protein